MLILEARIPGPAKRISTQILIDHTHQPRLEQRQTHAAREPAAAPEPPRALARAVDRQPAAGLVSAIRRPELTLFSKLAQNKEFSLNPDHAQHAT